MSSVRIAVVGAGLIGRKHIEILRAPNEAFSLAAVVDPSEQAAQEARQLGYRYFSTTKQMLDVDRPDGVIVAVPNQLHESVGRECIERRIPILVEKPITDSIDAALRLTEKAEAFHVPILVGHHRRHSPIMRRASEFIRNEGLGKIVSVASLWLSQKPRPYFDVSWRREPGGGPVLINAIHDIDCLRMLCGDVDTVQAMTSNAVRGFAVEDTAAAVLRFKSGAMGTLLVSDSVSTPWTWEWTSRENPFYPHEAGDCYWIAGTKGSLAVPSMLHRWHRPGEESWSQPLEQERLIFQEADPLIEQLNHFARVIRGLEAPSPNGNDGLQTLATTLAIHQSASEGLPVDIEMLIQKHQLK